MNKIKINFLVGLIFSIIICLYFSNLSTFAFESDEKINILDFKMPIDETYIDIQEFTTNSEKLEMFELAYKRKNMLWKIDFAQVLINYFEEGVKLEKLKQNDAIIEVWISNIKFKKLIKLINKLEREFESLKVIVKINNENQINVILNENKLIKIYNENFYNFSNDNVDQVVSSLSITNNKLANGSKPLIVYSTLEKNNDESLKNVDPDTLRKLAEPISFNVTNRPLNEVLEGFLRTSELNCTISSDVNGMVTLYIKNSTVKNVLDTLAKNYGLVYTINNGMIEIKKADESNMETIMLKLVHTNAIEVSNILNNLKSPNGNIIVDKKSNTLIIKDNVSNLESMKKVIESIEKLSNTNQVTTKLVTLNYADALKVKTMLTPLLTPEIGMMEVDARTNTLVITDLENNIKKIVDIISKLDSSKTISKVIQCKYVSADELKSTLNSALKTVLGINSEAFLIESDKTTNSLIVTASKVNLEKIEEFIKKLDVRTKQVLIEAKIVQVNLSRDESMGVNWNRLMQNSDKNENSINFKTFAPIGDDGIGGVTYKVGTLSTDQLRLVMQALQKKDNSKVIASPTIVTANRKKAYVNVETTYPVRRETVVTTTTGPVTSITYEKQNVSVRLEVTPAINPDGYIALEVNPKVQGLAGKVDNSQPIVSTKETLTNVVVKNGHTIVIAGLIEEENSTSKTNVPVFGNIPLISNLFKNQSNTTRKNETIIFITPRIVESGLPDDKKIAENKNIDDKKYK